MRAGAALALAIVAASCVRAPAGDLPAPLRPAWRAGAGRAWIPGEGRIVTAEGARVVTGAPCGGGLALDEANPVLWLPPGEPFSFPKAAAVQAATVERAAWRLAEVLGPDDALVPGGRADSDPARHHGVSVRSVKKTRRNGPPVLVAVGDRRGRIAVAVLDKDAASVLASDVVDTGVDGGIAARSLPVWDLDGDGDLELVLFAEQGEIQRTDLDGIRVVYDVSLDAETRLVRRGVAKGAPPRCD